MICRCAKKNGLSVNETGEPKIPLDEIAERIERVFEEIGSDQKRLAADFKKARRKPQDANSSQS
jgi:hypothetical protein